MHVVLQGKMIQWIESKLISVVLLVGGMGMAEMGCKA